MEITEDTKLDNNSPAEAQCCSPTDQLKTKCAMLRAVFSSMGDAVYYTDPDRRILDWNHVAEELTGYTADEVKGKFCRHILNHTDEHGEQLCDTRCPLLAAATHPGEVFFEEVWLKRKDGARISIEISCSNVRDENGTLLGMVEVFRDRTRQRELERMKEDFVAAITHDLKSPIASIMGFTDLLNNPKFGEIASEKREYVQRIRQSSRMLLALVGNIVDTARIEAGQLHYAMEDFSIDPLIKELYESFETIAEHAGVTLYFSAPGDIWLHADRGKILQVFHNLISNALRYTPGEGTIRLTAKKEAGQVHFEVADTGRGIPENEQERIFKKFVQVRGERQGSGLGLFIVKTILEGHDTAIHLESKMGKGSRFSFNLKEGAPSQEITPRKGSLLIVGEKSDTLHLIALTLEKEGHTIEVSGSGLEALQKAASSHADLIIIQHPLPDLKVEDFYYSIHNNSSTKTLPIILLSAVMLPGWKSKFAELISLPINISHLREVVNTHLNS